MSWSLFLLVGLSVLLNHYYVQVLGLIIIPFSLSQVDFLTKKPNQIDYKLDLLDVKKDEQI